MTAFEEEIRQGKRFTFGKNWMNFLKNLNEERIAEAERSLSTLLEVDNLKGLHLIDVGSGSGLFSLSARRMGALVSSFDYDPESVACANRLRAQHFPGESNWQIQQGSILDKVFLESLGCFDVVYSWGVLHHTGNMWQALQNVVSLVKANGILCIAVYNDQGRITRVWRRVKRIYCSGIAGRFIICSIFLPYFLFRALIASIVRKENIFLNYRRKRGMSIIHDWLDWLGGFPYETAKVEDIFRFYKDRGFILRNIVTSPGFGCNQYVFVKDPEQHFRFEGVDSLGECPPAYEEHERFGQQTDSNS